MSRCGSSWELWGRQARARLCSGCENWYARENAKRGRALPATSVLSVPEARTRLEAPPDERAAAACAR
eukprot:1086547-Alexandrium_andersonii.AAC.1